MVHFGNGDKRILSVTCVPIVLLLDYMHCLCGSGPFYIQSSLHGTVLVILYSQCLQHTVNYECIYCHCDMLSSHRVNHLVVCLLSMSMISWLSWSTILRMAHMIIVSLERIAILCFSFQLEQPVKCIIILNHFSWADQLLVDQSVQTSDHPFATQSHMRLSSADSTLHFPSVRNAFVTVL